MDFKNGVKNIQAAAYNGALTVLAKKWVSSTPNNCFHLHIPPVDFDNTSKFCKNIEILLQTFAQELWKNEWQTVGHLFPNLVHIKNIRQNHAIFLNISTKLAAKKLLQLKCH